MVRPAKKKRKPVADDDAPLARALTAAPRLTDRGYLTAPAEGEVLEGPATRPLLRR